MSDQQGTCKTTKALPAPSLVWYINGAPVTAGGIIYFMLYIIYHLIYDYVLYNIW